MAGIKIVDLPAVGRDLAATDLFEMSLVGGTGSRKITGQEIMNASKLSVNNTPVINGTAGRIFFQGSTNVLQQSANLFWDNTNGRLGIGTNTPVSILNLNSNNNPRLTLSEVGRTETSSIQMIQGSIQFNANAYYDGTIWQRDGTALPSWNLNMTPDNNDRFTIRRSPLGSGAITWTEFLSVRNTGNVLINTTTDAGFKLDVNGTARATSYTLGNFIINQASANLFTISNPSGPSGRLDLYGGNTSQANIQIFGSSGGNTNNISFNLGVTNRAVIFGSTGNFAINTTTDDGYRLDVNGTARVQDNVSIVKTANSNTALTITNSNSGSSAVASLNAVSNGATGALFSTSSTAAIYGAYGPSQSVLYSTQILSIVSDNVSGQIRFGVGTSPTERMRIASTGNVLINTTTDAGFRLDVNGTARIQGNTTITGTLLYLSHTSIGLSGNVGTGILELFNSSGSAGNTRISLGGGTYINIFQPRNSSSGITAGAINTITTPIAYAWDSGSASPNLFQLNPNYNFTGTYSGIVRGFYYNPSLSSMTGVTHYAIHSTSGRVRLEGLPTSPTGLSAGDLWNNGGVINIV